MATNTGATEPAAARVVTTILLMAIVAVLAVCFTRRIQTIKRWRDAPLTTWFLLIVYLDSTLFVVGTSILEKSFSINSSYSLCDGAVFFCLLFYLSTKAFVFCFLCDKVYLVRNPWKSRLKDKLYIFNMLIMMAPYITLCGFAFKYRIAKIVDNGVCKLGIERKILIPCTAYEFALNTFLTYLFLAPLRKLYSFNNDANRKLKRMARKTFIGAIMTMLATLCNLAFTAAFNGETGWVCLMVCNLDSDQGLFTVLVLHWVSSKDAADSQAVLVPETVVNPSVPSSPTPTPREDYDDISLCEKGPRRAVASA
ncbi:hypothetical protein BDV97DRAFT_413213 [Delphinella strobiligena]|nr:hypothetical protein BDV97DRAFT_413213 [Delphinella strobiligena]